MTALSQALEARGEIKGARKTLRVFLEARFGALPESVRQRIDTADADQLDRFVARAATIERPEAL